VTLVHFCHQYILSVECMNKFQPLRATPLFPAVEIRTDHCDCLFAVTFRNPVVTKRHDIFRFLQF
jgi:hypothetical protein